MYGIVSEDASEVWVVPIEDFEDPLVGMIGDQRIIAVRDATGETLPRVTGRHGLWFAFRTHYDVTHVLS